MRNRQAMATIPKNVAKHDVSLLWGQFIDDFRHAGIEEKASLLADEPEWMDIEDGKWSRMLAATAEALAHEADIQVPVWTIDEKYVSPVPIYGNGTKNKDYQAFLRDTSLPEFSRRNLFMGDNVLVRY